MPVTVTQEKKTLLVDEPEENSNRKSESQEDEKFEESKYWKKVDVLKAKFTEHLQILKEMNLEILPVYPNPKQKPVHKTGGVAQACGRIYMSRTLMRKDLVIVRKLKNHARKHRRGGQQTTALQSINFMLLLKNPIFLCKSLLIKLQIY